MKSGSYKLSFDKIILLSLAVILFLLGSAVILGWFTHQPLLTQYDEHLSPVQISTAYIFILIALCLFLIVSSRKWLAILSVIPVIFLSSLSLFEDFLNVNLELDRWFFSYYSPSFMVYPGRMAPNTAISFVLCGISLVLTALPYKHIRSIIAELLSGIASLIAALALFGYISGVRVFGWPHFTEMALYTSIALLVLGLGIFHFHYVHAYSRERIVYGPVFATIILAVGITFILWQSFKAQQYISIQKLAQNNADFIAVDLRRGLDDLSRELRRIALRWNVLDGYHKDLWDIDIQNYVTDIPSISFVGWYNKEVQLQDHIFNSMRQNRAQINKSNMQLVNEVVARGLQPPVEIVDSESTLFFIVALASSDVKKSGVLLVELDFAKYVESALPSFIFQKYDLEISDENNVVYAEKSSTSERIGEALVAEIALSSKVLTVKIFPTAETLTLVQSNMPNIVLILGIFIAFFMALNVLLAQLVLSSKREVDEALREKADALAFRQAILDSANYSIIATNTQGTILFFNKAAERMLLWSADEMVGRTTPVLFHDAEEMSIRAKELSEQLNETILPEFDVFVAMAKRGKVEEREWTYVRKDGSQFPVQLSVTPVKTLRGELVGFVGIAYDLTALKALDRMKGELIAITSHELRSPLTSIKGALDLIFFQETLSNDGKNMVDIARRNCERLLALTNDILDLQKIESGKMEFHFNKIGVRELLHKAAETNQLLAKTNQIILSESEIVPSCNIYGDADRLIQVLTNFISNAIKHSPIQGNVVLTAKQNGSLIRIGVKDQGPGIPKEYQSMIFQKFAQVPSGKPGVKGTGLGLTISKSIIESHKGTIGFDSSPAGCEFWFELPVVD